MEYIADFHIHSRFAMACSQNIDVEGLDITAKDKGIKIIGTGDFTHPIWIDELKRNLEEAEPGLYKAKGSKTGTRFIISAEVANIFDSGGKNRRVHNCILVPGLDDAAQINDAIKKKGALESDGRPALSMSCSELVEKVHEISNDAMVFPAHAWTPWFGVLGSSSGFDSFEDAYEDQVKHIHALEMGLSSDASMNWRLSQLDKFALLSNSDAHSLPKIGREANVFEFGEKDLSYASIAGAIKGKKLKRNIGFYPEEGKYHYDGHRDCKVSLSPKEAKKYNGRCPVCGKPLTIGVMNRVEQLADRPDGYTPKDAVPYTHAVPLLEVLAHITKRTTTSPVVKREYYELIKSFGTEFDLLLNADPAQISKRNPELAAAIQNVRSEHVRLIPGYDGVFGIVDIMNDMPEEKSKGKQASITEFG